MGNRADTARSNSADTTPSNMGAQLTLGIEFEVIVVYDDSVYKYDPESEDPQVRYLAHMAVQRILKSMEGVPVQELSPDCGLIDDTYDGWTVKSDCSVIPTSQEELLRPAGWRWDAVEVTTPILAASAASGANGPDWATTVSRVLQTLTRRMNRPGSHMWLYTNDSCGLHVHVGRGRCLSQPSFDTATVRKLYSIVTACERLIDTLHSVDRIGKNHHCQTPSYYLRPQAAMNHMAPNDALTWLKLVERVSQPHALPGGHSAAYNFANLRMLRSAGAGALTPSDWQQLNTIEFRQHRGTFAGPEVVAWADFLLCLVGFAERTDAAAVTALCAALYNDASKTVLDLMLAIGVSDSTREYYSAQRLPQADATNVSQALQDPSVQSLPIYHMLSESGRYRAAGKEYSTVVSWIRSRLADGVYGDYGANTDRLVQQSC